MSALATAAALAASQLDEVVANARIRASFESFFLKQSAVLLGSEFVEAHSKRALQGILRLHPTDPNILYRGLFVQAVAVFEAYVKRLIEALLAKQTARAKTFAGADAGLVAANFSYTGMMFQKTRDDYAAGGRSYDALVDGLLTCRPGDAPLSLNADAFTYLLGNCTPKKLEDRLTELGEVTPFDTALGKTSTVKKWAQNAGARAAANLARGKLQTVMRTRNDLTHPTGISGTVTLTEVEEVCAFFQALTEGLSELYG